MAEFRINYIKVLNQARQIQELSSELKAQYNELDTMSQEMKMVWKGNASYAAQQELELMKADLLKSVQNLDTIGNTIQSVATLIQRQDEKTAADAAALAGGGGGGGGSW